MTAATHEPEEVIEDRLEQITDLGYTVAEAEELANARSDDGRRLIHASEIQKLLDKGATHTQVVRILRPLPKWYDSSISEPDKRYE